MNKRIFYRSFVSMLMLEILSSVAAIIDCIIVGRELGAKAMAVNGLVAPYFSFIFCFVFLFSIGTNSICSKKMARVETDEANSYFSTSVILCFGIGLIISVVGFVFSDTIVTMLGAGKDPELFLMAKGYLRGLLISTPIQMLIPVLTPLINLDGAFALTKIISITVLAADVIGDLLAVRVFKLSMLGIGIASSVSYYIAFIILLFHFMRKDTLLKFRLSLIRMSNFPEVAKEGIPWTFLRICTFTGGIVINNLMMRIGDANAASGLSVRLYYMLLVGSIGVSLAKTITAVLSFFAADCNKDAAEEVLDCSKKLVLFTTIPLSIITAVFARYIAMVFIRSNTESLTNSTAAIIACAASLFFTTMTSFLVGDLQMLNRKRYATMLNIFSEFAILVPVAYLLSSIPQFGYYGIYYAYPCTAAICFIIGLVIVKVLKKNDVYYFELKENTEVYSKMIFTSDDVAEASEKVGVLASRINYKDPMLLAACVEEYTENVLEHGIVKPRKTHCSVRTVCTEDSLRIIIRDDGRAFNIKERISRLDSKIKKPEEDPGIRIIAQIANDIEYANVLGVNNLIIRVRGK